VYDTYNKLSTKTEANAGTVSTKYNAYNELVKQTDANGNNYNYTYDNLGRIIKRNGPEGISSYEYYCKAKLIGYTDLKGNAIYFEPESDFANESTHGEIANGIFTYCCNNNVTKITGWNGIVKSFDYDNFGRLLKKNELVDGVNYEFKYGYDVYDNNVSITYPSGIVIENNYDAIGYLTSVNQQGNSNVIYQTNTVNGQGQLTEYKLGDGHTSNQSYYDGYPTSFTTQGLQRTLQMSWNTQTGNLLSRYTIVSGSQGPIEEFTYDNLNRLTSSQVAGQPLLNYNYDPYPNTGSSNGNLKVKDDAGLYSYTGLPHTPSSIAHPFSTTLPPDNISVNDQEIKYTPFQRVENIMEDGYQINFIYEPGYNRVKSILTQNSNLIETKLYFDDFEIQKNEVTGNVNYIHYVNGGTGLCAMIVMDNNGTNTYYVYKDHLGSINIVTDDAGNIIADQAFDAWGRQRNPIDWTYTTPNPIAPEWLYRGFTGHEHLPLFGLINMNARLYDPVAGKMISPDNYVANIYSSQAYNRYNYANNNPLVYTDPDGNHPVIIGLLLYGLFFTETGYKVQKVLSPIAVHVKINIGSNNIGLGLEASVGLPQFLPASIRVHGGIGYNFKNYDVGAGWEAKWGLETGLSVFGLRGTTYATNHYYSQNSEFNQMTGVVGIFAFGGLASFSYENDYHPDKLIWLPSIGGYFDGGDRFRTAALRLNLLCFSVGFNLFTGDPADASGYRSIDPHHGNKKGTYDNPNADKYRAGVLYIGIGPLRFGWNSESIRHAIQNVWAHDCLMHGESPWFKRLDSQFPDKLYWNFGTGFGNGLW
jgi:RHS repeat-associated protein